MTIEFNAPIIPIEEVEKQLRESFRRCLIESLEDNILKEIGENEK